MKKVFKYIIIIILVIILVLFVLSKFNFTILDNIFSKGDTENLTIILKTDNDFLEWFKDFNTLYQKKKGRNYPDFSIKEEMFESIKDLLEEKESSTYYKDGKYFVSDSETLELDVNTRSFRYTKYKNDKTIEIMEVRLINGKYLIQLINNNYLYRISFNKSNINKTMYKNDNNVRIEDDESIFQTVNFDW